MMTSCVFGIKNYQAWCYLLLKHLGSFFKVLSALVSKFFGEMMNAKFIQHLACASTNHCLYFESYVLFVVEGENSLADPFIQEKVLA